MKREKFWSKSNIYNSIWALIIGAVMFGFGSIWTKLTQPVKVVEINKLTTKDTTVTIIKFQPDENYFNKLNNLSSKIIQKNDIDSISLIIAKEYISKLDSFSLEIKNRSLLTSPIKEDSFIIKNESFNFFITQPKRPKFIMPLTKGYMYDPRKNYATYSLNSNEFKSNEVMSININLFDKNIINKITPLFIEIVELKTNKKALQIWSEQYDLKSKMNKIYFHSRFKPGKYILTAGFYFLKGLDNPFPDFYFNKFNIEIK